MLLHDLLQFQDAVEDCFGVGRAAGDVDVHGHDLINALHDSNPDVRMNAAGALGDIGKDGRFAIAELGRALKDENPGVREQVAKRANRNGILSEAELIHWARELKISAGRALKALSPDVQAQARAQPPGATRKRAAATNGADAGDAESRATMPDPVLAAITVLLTDAEIRSRCADLLRRPRNFDRRSAELRAISLFTLLIARETSSVTWAIFSLTLGGTPSFEMTSLQVTTLPMTFRFVPHERQ